MDYKKIFCLLHHIPILDAVSECNKKLLAFACRPLTYEDGETLFHIHEMADDVYVVIKGEVEQLVFNEQCEVPVGVIGEHELFGEMAVIQNIPRLVSARARGKVEVLRIEGEMFVQMVTSTPEAALSVMQGLSAKIADNLSKLGEDYVRVCKARGLPPADAHTREH